MAKRLSEHLNSLYLGAANKMRSKTARKKSLPMWKAMMMCSSGAWSSMNSKTTGATSR